MAINKEIVALTHWTEMLDFVKSRGRTFNGVNWATVLSKLGKSSPKEIQQMKNDSRFPMLVGLVAKNMVSKPLSEFGDGARHVANVVHALAKLKHVPRTKPSLWRAINDQSKWLVSEAKPQEVSSVAWSFARLNVKSSDGFFQEIERQSSSLVAEGVPRTIANTAWAAAKLNHNSPKLFREIDAHAAAIVASGKPQEISNTAWAAATLGHSSPALFKEIEMRSSFLVTEGKPQEIANTAWAAARLSHPSPLLFGEIEKRPSCIVKSAFAVDFSHTAWACGKLQYDAPAFLAAVDASSARLIESGKIHEIANVACAFAEIGHRPTKLFDLLEKRADGLVELANEQDICNVSWSLVTLGLASEKEALLQALWKRAREADPSKLRTEELVQLVQVEVHARASGVKLPPAPPDLKKMMIRATTVLTNASSRSEDEYSALLAEAGFKHEREVSG